jgi:hypothetical protein
MTFLEKRGVTLALIGVLLGACSSGTKQSGGTGSGGTGGSKGTGGSGGTFQVDIPSKVNNKLDLLFMIDNADSMTAMQQKLLAQIPTFIQVLQGLPSGPPDLHVAVISSDMGAQSDSTAVTCTPSGDQGQFQSQPRGTCTATTLASGATFLTDANGQMNFTDPIENVIQCIGQLGANGCGFVHQLASIDRALGSDGTAPPATNANFLRSDAFLGIVILSNEDDCSAPPSTTIYSLNGQAVGLTNPDGPLQRYRCNGGPRGGHLCKDTGTGQMMIPPITPPADATGNPALLNLTSCQDNTTGSSALIPVATFIQHVKALKTDPDKQILVGAIVPPATPYGVAWLTQTGSSGEAWPTVLHSCGAQGGDLVNPAITQSATDGSFGDPAVRIAQFVNGFSNSVLASICDATYRQSMTAIATKLGNLVASQSCIGAGVTIQEDSNALPFCTVTAHVSDSNGNVTDHQLQNCGANSNTPPCWTLATDATACPAGGFVLQVIADSTLMDAAALTTTLKCNVCQPGSTKPGC